MLEPKRISPPTFVAPPSAKTGSKGSGSSDLEAKVGVAAIPTLPFVTASISSTPKRESGDHTDFVVGLNLCVIGAPPRFVISSYSSHHSGTNVAEAEVDSLVRSSVLIMTTVTTITSTVDPASVAKEKPVKPSLFSVDSSSAGGIDPNTGVFSNLIGNDFLVGVIRTVITPDTDLQKFYFFASVCGMENDQLFTEFNVGAAHQMSLSAEVRLRAKYNVKEKRRLKSVVERQGELLKVIEEDIENLKAQLLLREAEAAKAIRLCAKAFNFETVEKYLWDETNALKEHNVILEKERDALDVKVTELETSVAGKECELTDLNSLITSVKYMSWRQLLPDSKRKSQYGPSFGGEVLPPPSSYHLWSQYLSALGAAIGKAIKKGMQDGLSVGITHGKEDRSLTNVAAYNPSAEVNYVTALQQLQNVNFSLLARLKSNKDASVETVMGILRLEGPLAEKLGLNEFQPNVDQLMVPIHSSLDKVVIGATALSLALDVSSVRVRKIRENIANQRSTL
ncbi:hypothetical protein Tco_0517757 [Tanacetum coccineum]